jgi:hypothetical protein
MHLKPGLRAIFGRIFSFKEFRRPMQTRFFGGRFGMPRCGARTRILAEIHPPEAICKILDCLGLPSRPPPIAAAVTDMDEPCFS